MFRLTTAAALTAACMATTARGQAQCAPADAVADRLAEQYGETIAHVGLDTRGVLIEWWENPETGSWTLIVLRPDGARCFIASGDMGRAVEPEPAGLRL